MSGWIAGSQRLGKATTDASMQDRIGKKRQTHDSGLNTQHDSVTAIDSVDRGV